MEINKPIDAILLDFDGTLVNLSLDWEKLKNELNKYFLRYGINKDFTPLLPSIKFSISQASKLPETREYDIQNDVNNIFEKFEIEGLKKSTVIPYASYLLKIIHRKRIRTIIISSNGENVIKKAFIKYKLERPDCIYSRNSSYHKPDKNLAKMIIKDHKLEPNNCLIIGNSEIDKLFGEKAHIDTYILGSDFKSLKELGDTLLCTT